MTNRALLAAAALLWTLPAWGADQFLPGKSLLLRSPASGRQRAVFVAKSASLVAPTPSGPDDPRTTGATLEFRSLLDDESATLSLPAAGWTANPTGTVYHFHGTDVVKVALVKTGATLRVVAKSTGITLDEATQGSIGVILTSGTTRYCALFGGTIVHDEPGKFIAKNAPAPLVCPTSTVTTTSSTTSTTTTSTTLPECGTAATFPSITCRLTALGTRVEQDVAESVLRANLLAMLRGRVLQNVRQAEESVTGGGRGRARVRLGRAARGLKNFVRRLNSRRGHKAIPQSSGQPLTDEARAIRKTIAELAATL